MDTSVVHLRRADYHCYLQNNGDHLKLTSFDGRNQEFMFFFYNFCFFVGW